MKQLFKISLLLILFGFNTSYAEEIKCNYKYQDLCKSFNKHKRNIVQYKRILKRSNKPVWQSNKHMKATKKLFRAMVKQKSSYKIKKLHRKLKIDTVNLSNQLKRLMRVNYKYRRYQRALNSSYMWFLKEAYNVKDDSDDYDDDDDDSDDHDDDDDDSDDYDDDDDDNYVSKK